MWKEEFGLGKDIGPKLDGGSKFCGLPENEKGIVSIFLVAKDCEDLQSTPLNALNP